MIKDKLKQILFTSKLSYLFMYWFEYDSEKTRAVTPGYEWCEKVMQNYLQANDITFTPAWFNTLVNWKDYE